MVKRIKETQFKTVKELEQRATKIRRKIECYHSYCKCIKYKCTACKYFCYNLSNYKKHLKTVKHCKNVGGDVSNCQVYECKKCNYKTGDWSNYVTHLDSRKHLGLSRNEKHGHNKCFYCDYTTSNTGILINHCKSKRHLKKAGGDDERKPYPVMSGRHCGGTRKQIRKWVQECCADSDDDVCDSDNDVCDNISEELYWIHNSNYPEREKSISVYGVKNNI